MIRAKSLRLLLVACVGVAGMLGTSVHAQRGTSAEAAKSAESLRSAFKDATAKVSKSTVSLRTEERGNERRVALGTVVSEDGFILTKASEVMSESRIYASIPTGGATRRYDAKIVGYSAQHDLAMLKIDVVGLVPVTFADTRPPPGTEVGPEGRRGGRGGRGGRGRRGGPVTLPTPATAPAPPAGAVPVEVGQWVASVDAGATLGNAPSTVPEQPFAVGVISVSRRYVPFRSGALGVQFAMAPAQTQPGRGGRGRGFGGGPGGPPTPPPPPATRGRGQVPPDTAGEELGEGAKVVQVVPLSPAEKVGIKVDDVITAVNGTPVRNGEELRDSVQRFRPGDVVTVTVKRGEETLTFRAALGTGSTMESANPLSRLSSGLISGPLSLRASDFPAVFQHDTVIIPSACGGPLVDLEGRVIGINIARAERTESYALPADLIVPLIEPMKSGKLAPVNANAPAASATRPG